VHQKRAPKENQAPNKDKRKFHHKPRVIVCVFFKDWKILLCWKSEDFIESKGFLLKVRFGKHDLSG
jgi:hypothetical protein